MTKLMTERLSGLSPFSNSSQVRKGDCVDSRNRKDHFVGISIWNSKADSDRFTQGQSQKLLESYKPLLQAEPTFGSFNVEGSTTEAASARAASPITFQRYRRVKSTPRAHRQEWPSLEKFGARNGTLEEKVDPRRMGHNRA